MQAVAFILGGASLFGEINEAGASRHVGQGDILRDTQRHRQPLFFAVFGQVANTSSDRAGRRFYLQLLAIKPDGASINAIRTKYSAREFGAPGPNQSGKAQNLASAYLE